MANSLLNLNPMDITDNTVLMITSVPKMYRPRTHAGFGVMALAIGFSCPDPPSRRLVAEAKSRIPPITPIMKPLVETISAQPETFTTIATPRYPIML